MTDVLKLAEELETLAKKATAGPWKQMNTAIWRDTDGPPHASIAADYVKQANAADSKISLANTALIVALVNNLPQILAALRSQRPEIVESDLAAARRIVAGQEVCEGCDSAWTMEELRQKPGVISCCPERKMRKATSMEVRLARAAIAATSPTATEEDA